MKIVVSSDWHLDWSTAGLERFDDIAEAARAVVNAAIDLEADLFLFLGDLANPDQRRAWRASAFSIEADRELTRAKVQTLWIAGNHDVIEDGSGTTTLSPLASAGGNVANLPRLFDVRDWKHQERVDHLASVVALPYTARDQSYDPALVLRQVLERLDSVRLAKPIIVAGHLMIDGAELGSESTDMARGRDMTFPSLALRELSFPYTLAMNGHYHRRQVITDAHGVRIYIPGSLARLTRGEAANVPGYLVVEV